MKLSAHARIASLAAAAALIVLLVVWNAGNPTIAALVSVPLLAPLPGLWRSRPYTYAWASLLTLPYIALLLTEFWVGANREFSGPALLAAVTLFSGCLLFVRWRTRETP